MIHIYRSFFILCVVLFTAPTGLAQTYLWPLDAEPAITSTFCEYRPGHFHSGIDLKTWRRLGLNVFAVDDGYVWRVKVSPWGSGRALYIRLTDGRCAVYFHLSEYASFIQSVVEREQERVGRYSIDLFPEPGELPVRGGQVVAFSGESGTGGPHLHFEIRDSLNRPLNPFMNGFPVDDTLPPHIQSLSVTPLDVQATVNGEHGSVLVPAHQVSAGIFYAEESVTISGPVGIGVQLYDRTNTAKHKLAVFETDLYIDDTLSFRSRYDRFSFQHTQQVNLDRDFSLIHSGHGQYQRLYRVEGNTLPFYIDDSAGGGHGPGDSQVLGEQGWTSVPGWHTIRVMGRDARGNESKVEMKVLVDHPPLITNFQGHRLTDLLKVEATVEDPDDEIQLVRFTYSTDYGETWRPLAVDSCNVPPGVYEAEMKLAKSESVLCSARAMDSYGVWSEPHMCSISQGVTNEGSCQPLFQCEPTFYETFVEWTITTDRPLVSFPRAMVTYPGGDSVELDVVRWNRNRFCAIYAFQPHLDGRALLSINTGDQLKTEEPFQLAFDVYTVTRGGGGRVTSTCGKAQAVFQPDGVYATCWTRVESDSMSTLPFLPVRSEAYQFYPVGVPFDKGARVTLAYDDEEGQPVRIGLYRRNGGGEWSYIGAEVDTLKRTISAVVSSFGCFALLEDTLVPEVWDLQPEDGSQVRTEKTVLFARVRDRGSGIEREENLVMELDDRRVIAEYDPEGDWMKQVNEKPLDPGPHTLRIMVTDMAGNTTIQESRFRVVQ